jgi:FMN phosphatase YigB (HAD superfamily)
MIDTVVFDVGWVFVNLRPQRILAFLERHGVALGHLDALVARIDLVGHETGRVRGRDFLSNIAALADERPHLDDVHAHWNDMFELQPGMVRLACRLAERRRVFLLSNVGDLHWTHLAREYGIHRIGHDALPSFVAGVMKPDTGIYAEAERRFALTPARTVFIDDRAENIAACRARGWHGIVHRSEIETAQELARLGVVDSRTEYEGTQHRS